MDSDENDELCRVGEQISSKTRIVDPTADMCAEVIKQAQSQIKTALDKAVKIGSYSFYDAQNVMDTFCQYTSSLQDNLSSNQRTSAFFAARAARDMTAMALAIGQGLPSSKVLRLARAGFDEKARNKKAGDARGNKLKQEAEETWQPHALELAIEIEKEDDFTQREIADKIIERWRLHIRCPESMLVPLIAKWQRQGKLKKRPRAATARKSKPARPANT